MAKNSDNVAEKLIYGKIIEVMRSVSHIGKDRSGSGLNYKFRGIDDVYNTFHEPMAEAGIFITPNVVDVVREERTSGKGKPVCYSIVTVNYKFFASDGSYVECTTVGEGMDFTDKGINKALSAALKYAFFQVFCIPTEGQMIDSEVDNIEVGSKPKKKLKQKPSLIQLQTYYSKLFKATERDLRIDFVNRMIDGGGITSFNDLSPEQINIIMRVTTYIVSQLPEGPTLAEFAEYLYEDPHPLSSNEYISSAIGGFMTR
jgi:hypothetical protein